MQALTQSDSSATVVSIDGVGAFDNIRRRSMLDGLANLPRSSAMLPFVRMFYGDRSEYLWYDDDGQEHSVWQGEGGEQGDPLMPALYSLGQHPALQAVQELLQDDEYLLAFLDDVYFVCQPERVQVLFAAVSEALAVQAGVQVNHGKTRVWNAAGIAPPGVEHLGDGKAWVGDHAVPTHAQGLKSCWGRRWAMQTSWPRSCLRCAKAMTCFCADFRACQICSRPGCC